MELIDKAAVVAEINRQIKLFGSENYKCSDRLTVEERLFTLNSIKEFISTLEVKEVDLEKEIDSYFECFQNVSCDEDCCNEGGFCCVLDNDLKIVDIERCRKIARHFFLNLDLMQHRKENNNATLYNNRTK